ncbi:NUDIX domain-containing protein [Sphaerimonospora cavernae]|uniref:NUDIX domain-containing protein n=1 Tax=Sphaerimonospora cavernae TaxID=1740611 RepID=A0ABV6U2N3_9ACTN
MSKLPHHLVGAGVVLRDSDGRVLLVRPTYRSDTWEIPGGALEHGEYPWEAAVREVREEIGLALRPGRLLAVDVVPAQSDGQPPLVNFVFDGGVLSPAEAAVTRPCDEELSAVAWSTRQERNARLAPHMARRIDACLQAAETGRTVYLQYGYGAAFLMLLLAAPRSPRPRAGKEVDLWAAAVVAAARAPVRLSLMSPGETGTSFGWTAYTAPRSLWSDPALWGCKADSDGLLVVLVTLAATASGVLAGRMRRRLTLAIGALLILAAFEAYVPAVILLDADKLRQEPQLDASMLIRWHLVVAAALVATAAFVVRPAAHPSTAP